MPSLSVIRTGVTGLVLLLFLAVAIISLSAAGSPTYWFPAFIGVGGTLAAAYSFGHDLRKVLSGQSVLADEVTDIGASIDDTHDDDGETDQPRDRAALPRRAVAWALWLIALPVLGLVIPFFYASLLWLVLVLHFYARRGWLLTGVSVGVFAVVLNVLVVLLDVELPPAILTGLG
ncbi:hypothetical protein GCM10023169_35920 [Georgenia halophila]|uniref:DUF1468 domain-containing protein n=1 Tax=Georgenia halophila TaxID=620889 RepID=A0ABP8LKC5_9MICO